MAKNENLHKAKEAKNDEFYTQLSDIENELKHYKQHFKDKVVLCNCDDPFESNFFKYFAMNFNYLGLKKLICTCYATSPIMYTQLSLFGEERSAEAIDGKKPYKIEITEVPDSNGDGAIDITDVEYLIRNDKNVLTILKGDGDFRSDECLDLLDKSDIVVTNPPFSLFREYVACLVEHNKKFLIIGNMNSFICKELFPLIMENKMWFGASIHSGDRKFYVPDYYPLDAAGCGVDEDGRRFIRVKGVRWYTNLDYDARHEKLILWKNYTSLEYPKYDNYDAINVNKYSEIPMDYDGIMGVPISFIDHYCPEQFEIVWQASGNTRACCPSDILNNELHYIQHKEDRGGCAVINGKRQYSRILIRKKGGD